MRSPDKRSEIRVLASLRSRPAVIADIAKLFDEEGDPDAEASWIKEIVQRLT